MTAYEEKPALLDERPPALDASAPDLAADGGPAPVRAFEDLTLGEALAQFWRSPMATLRALLDVATTPRDADAPRLNALGVPLVEAELIAPIHAPLPEVPPTAETFDRALEGFQFALRVIAFIVAVQGGAVILNAPVRSEPVLDSAAPYFVLGFLLWLAAELLPLFPPWRNHDVSAERHERVGVQPGVPTTAAFLLQRLAFGGATVVCALLAAEYTRGNRVTETGVLAWIGSIFFVVWTFAPVGWGPLKGLRDLRDALLGWTPRLRLTTVTLLAIISLGAYFRLYELAAVPPEMTSDHIEKLINVQQVTEGTYEVFFANNGGREPLHMYLGGLLAGLPGLGVNFDTLKLLSALEGVLTLPVLYWLGRVVIGRRDPHLGELVGLGMAALVAVSYWHEVLSRLGLRIVLTPLFMALIVIFLTRALRDNRRGDFIAAGLVLGFGLYTYQVIRLAPVVIVAGVLLALALNLRGWVARREMLVNLGVLALIAFTVFVPLFSYSLQFPEDFWRRASGRLFGDELTQQTDEEGNLVFRQATLQERLNAFNQNLPVLMGNIRNALLMYNWKGDVAWFNNVPNQPAFDPLSGGLLIVGAAAWIGRMVRRREATDWLLPLMLLIMLMPSALSIAYPIENPSATRTSGSLIIVYLLAALALALLVRGLWRLGGRGGAVIGVVAAVGIVGGSYSLNYQTYFRDYRSSYLLGSVPYSDGGQLLRDFAANNGGYGNAFIISYPYWWDHRILGMEGGRINWPNTIPSLEDTPRLIHEAYQRDSEYRLDLTYDLLFFYAPQDEAAQQWLQETFPLGFWQSVTTSQPEDTFNVFRVPALFESSYQRLMEAYDLDPTLR